MSLNWQWKEKRGWMESEHLKEFPEWKCWLYHGNALMILLNETENQWQMHGFFVDNEHAKRCLDDGMYKDCTFHLYKHKSNKKLAKLLTSYYITIIWEDEPNEAKNQ